MAYGIIANQTPQVDAFTKDQTLQSTTAALYGLSGVTALPDNAFQQIKSLIDNANANTNLKTESKIVSYIGTGTFGESNPCSVSADFPIQVAIHIRNTDYDPLEVLSVMISQQLTTSYTQGNGLEPYKGDTKLLYGKKSSDGHSFYWYNTDSANGQCNASGETYIFLLLG